MIKQLRENLPLAIVLTFIATVFTYNLGKWSFWFDESFTSVLISYDYIDVISRTANDVHPPLYYLFLKAWSAFFGTSDIALRSMSVLFMLGALGVLYGFMKRATTSRVATPALLVAGLSPFIVRYAQEARMYAFAAFILSLASVLLAKLMGQKKADRSNWWWAAYTLLITSALYTHYFTFPIVFAHAMYVLLSDTTLSINKKLSKQTVHDELKKLDLRWLYATATAGILFVPWIPPLYRQTTRINDGFWIEEAGIYSIPDMLSQMLLLIPVQTSTSGAYKVAALVATLLGFGALILVWRRAKRSEKGVMTLLLGPTLITAFTLLAYSVLPFTASIFYVRYFASFSVLFYLGLVYVLWLSRSWLSQAALVSLSLLMLLALGSGTKTVIDGYDRDWGVANRGIQALNGVLREGDVVIADGFWNHYDTHHYLLPSFTVQTLVVGEFDAGEVLLENRDDWILENYEAVEAPNGYVWFVSGTGSFALSDTPDNWESVQILFSDNNFKVQRFIINE